jgi:hypothetical protein
MSSSSSKKILNYDLKRLKSGPAFDSRTDSTTINTICSGNNYLHKRNNSFHSINTNNNLSTVSKPIKIIRKLDFISNPSPIANKKVYK